MVSPWRFVLDDMSAVYFEYETNREGASRAIGVISFRMSG
jgi:hypothetical protein